MARARARRPWRPATLERQERFLAAYAESGLVLYASQAAGQNRKVHYQWLEQSMRTPSYERRFRKLEAAVRAAEEAEHRRFCVELMRNWPHPSW